MAIYFSEKYNTYVWRVLNLTHQTVDINQNNVGDKVQAWATSMVNGKKFELILITSVDVTVVREIFACKIFRLLIFRVV